MALQEDGKIVAGGFMGQTDGNRSDFGVARFNSDGSFNVGFADEGKVKTDFAGGDDEIWALLLLPDGKILAAGSAEDNPHHDGLTNFALARYHGGEGLGIEKNNKSKSLVTIYPNPGNGRFSIQTEALVSSVSITNILGQRVKNPLFLSENQHYTVDLSKEQPGMYFLSLKTEQGILTKKIMVR